MTLTYFIYGIKTTDIDESFSQCKEIIGLSNYSEKIVKLLVCIMKDETTSVVIKIFFGLSPAISFFLVDSIKKWA